MRRSSFLVALGAVGLAGCGLGLPPAGNYASISGKVTDAATGAALPNAVVTVNGVLSSQTDAQGAYRIPVVPTGPWSYAVTAPGYATMQSDQPDQLMPGEKRAFPVKLVASGAGSGSASAVPSASALPASPSPSPSH